MRSLPLSARLAWRELRAGVAGFRLFLACLALGVGAIAAAGSTASAFRAGLAAQGRAILGGDLSVTVHDRRFTPAEWAAMRRAGAVDDAVAAEAMAQAPSGERRLVELRGVGPAWPLVGRPTLAGAPDLAHALAGANGAAGVAVEQALLDRLGLKLRDRFLLGAMPVVADAVLVAEPDRLSRGFALGPRVLAPLDVVARSGLLGPGLPFGETARIALPPGERLGLVKARLRRALHIEGGELRLRDRDDAAPGLRKLLGQLEYFLSFIGLASLVAGGIGVAGAVTAFLDRRVEAIATLKTLGADGALTRNVYLIQIGAMALLGVGAGLAVGAALPLALGRLLQDALPAPALFALYPWPLARAAAFGLLTAAAFALVPLARARVASPSALYRQAPPAPPAWGGETAFALAAAVGLAALAVAAAPTPLVAVVMIGALAFTFAVLAALGRAGGWAAGRLRRLARGPVRIALANLAGPHSPAPRVAPAMGLGVALIAAVALIQANLLGEVRDVAPRSAPALIFTDIPADRAAAFDAALARAFGRPLTADTYLRAPFATGRIVAVRGAPVQRGRMPADDRWAYDNDIAFSAIGPQPVNAGVTAGAWWPAAYAGPPLVALSTDAAQGARIAVGDTITFALLGRRIDARVAALRKLDFAQFGAEFPVVLDPAALAGADLANVAMARASPREEGAATRALGADFPQVGVISVREALEAVAGLFDRLSLAIRACAAIVALAGLLVLAGAVAARAGARSREAATLAALGASRAQILTLYAVEYGATGLVAGATGVGAGGLAAWLVVRRAFDIPFSLDGAALGLLLAACGVAAAAAGLLAALHALGRRPAAALRAE